MLTVSASKQAERTMASLSNTILGRLIDGLAAWFAHRRDIGELSRLSRADFVSIASDLRLSPLDLARLTRKGSGGADNLSRLLGALGIDSSAIASTEPAVMRDMERVCAACPHTTKCRRALRAGTAGRTYRKFCANSGTFDGFDRQEAPAPVGGKLPANHRPAELEIAS
jgi:hypothetical protein